MNIQGDLIYLTPITCDDSEDFVRWRNSDLIKSRFIYRKNLTVEDQNNWVRTRVETGQVVQFIIWDKADNKKIGCVYLQHIDKEQMECEFGILIGEEAYLGGGRGTEANNLICEYGFKELGMHKIYLRVLAENERARRSYMKAGYQENPEHEQIMIEGQPQEVVFMSKLNPYE